MLLSSGTYAVAATESALARPAARVWIRSTSSVVTAASNAEVPTAGAASVFLPVVGQENSMFSRYERCVFGISVFDSLDSRDNPSLSSLPDQQQLMLTKEATFQHEVLHYDRRMIYLSEAGTDATKASKQEEVDQNGHPHYRVILASSPFSSAAIGTEKGGRHWSQPLPLGRAKHYPPLGATVCPTTIKKIDPNSEHYRKKPFTQLAVVGLVLDSPRGEHVLLTRRPSHMRSFPGAWVLPGGGFDPGAGDASLKDALQREIQEETGLSLSQQQHEDDENGIRPLCLWESCYPTDPHAPGPIRAHHMVVFFKAVCEKQQGMFDKSSIGTTATKAFTSGPQRTPPLQLQESEVDSALWLSVEDFQHVLKHMNESGESKGSSPNSSTLQSSLDKPISIYNSDGSIVQGSLQTLVGIYPQQQQTVIRGAGKGKQQEWCGIAQGSLFALEELSIQSQAKSSVEESTVDKVTTWIQSDDII